MDHRKIANDLGEQLEPKRPAREDLVVRGEAKPKPVWCRRGPGFKRSDENTSGETDESFGSPLSGSDFKHRRKRVRHGQGDWRLTRLHEDSRLRFKVEPFDSGEGRWIVQR